MWRHPNPLARTVLRTSGRGCSSLRLRSRPAVRVPSLQAALHGGGGDAAAQPSAASRGLCEASEVTWIIQHGGWGNAVGKAAFSCTMEQLSAPLGPIIWQRWAAPSVELSRTAYMLVLQGMPFTQIFDHGCWFERGPEVVFGPFFYLKGNNNGLRSARPRLRDVVLARVVQAPEGQVARDLQGLLLARVLA